MTEEPKTVNTADMRKRADNLLAELYDGMPGASDMLCAAADELDMWRAKAAAAQAKAVSPDTTIPWDNFPPSA